MTNINLHGVTKITEDEWKDSETKEGNNYKTKRITIESRDGNIELILFSDHAKKVDNLIKVDNKIVDNTIIENIYEE